MLLSPWDNDTNWLGVNINNYLVVVAVLVFLEQGVAQLFRILGGGLILIQILGYSAFVSLFPFFSFVLGFFFTFFFQTKFTITCIMGTVSVKSLFYLFGLVVNLYD